MVTYLNKLLLFLLLPTLLIATDNTLENTYENILITYSTVYTYEAKFIQENYWAEINIDKISEGKLYYDKENLLMDYSQPDGQKLLINEEYMTMYDPIADQAMISDEFDIELRPDKLISHYWDISEKEIIDKFDDTIKIKLKTPQEENIIITISNKLVTEFNIVDENGNFIIYKFYNIKINEGLPENIFELTLPESTNIFDTRNNK
ncbi:MAG: outer membrane lipoprotein carrier protein LolA [Candidatus Cloacimonetes bacterium]|jgi:outer membrane lipoprotein-sorting protein|nr:outer membrane lipoprotein carrier protein LolA [Candidatus Cloacimonadota bacterium]MBT4576652.1 outer membrane lipoprotein carrier protein LolA [Candidatus Cloacimonadota bacterium]MBT5420933.1 outer membrane lipoprotein carrier protein LolA [Candidatus Cloacimonadota bacterium]